MTTNGDSFHALEMEPEDTSLLASTTTANKSSSIGSAGLNGRRGGGHSNNKAMAVVDSIAQTSNRKNVLYVAIGLLALVVIALNLDLTTRSSTSGENKKGPSSSAAQFVFVDPTDPGTNEEEPRVPSGRLGEEIIFVEPPPKGKDNENSSSDNDNESGTTITVAPAANEEEATKPPEPEPKPRNPKVKLLDPDIERGEIPEEKANLLRGKWGGWHFWDGDKDMRPKNDYVHDGHPNGDIPGDQFPDESWQVDAVYVNHYLDAASDLVQMGMEAIFSEYGWGKPQDNAGMMERIKMFRWERVDLATQTAPPPTYAKKGPKDTGGWTTKRSFDGLIRRILHAMITEDTFTVVLAGHSAAMGEGNHFRQSYMMQFHQIMKPVFERLGVKLITRNISYGGLGTIQNSMAFADVYGHDIDLILWDSGMTENCCPAHIDLFFRQALISGNRVPVIWSSGTFDLLRILHEEFDADVGEWGNGLFGIKAVESEEQAKTIPWAARFLKCTNERQDLCNQDRFAVNCWIDRDDGIKPEAAQRERPKGQVKWHPGWRMHQLQGRVLAFAMLEAVELAASRWMEGTMTGQPLDEEYWHVTDYFENIRNKVRNAGTDVGFCSNIAENENLPARMCNTPMKGRTQYTPRADYDRSLASIVKPTANGYVPSNKLKPLYDGPDVHNTVYDIPDGEIDVLAIVMNRRRSLVEDTVRRIPSSSFTSSERTLNLNVNKTVTSAVRSRKLGEDIVPGLGWEITGEPQGTCDGSYDAICGHSTDNDCFLLGHHAARGAIVGTEWSGWLVFQLEAVENGIIVIKLHTWHWANENPLTNGWTTVNNERRLHHDARRRSSEENSCETCKDATQGVDWSDIEERELMRSYSTPDLPDTFAFDYAIDGQITTLNKEQFLEKKRQIQRVVETLTLLDDASFNGGQPKDVEVAIRLRGVERKVAFGVSHIYWA